MNLKVSVSLKLAPGHVKDVLTRGVFGCGDEFKGESHYLGGRWMDDFLVSKVVEG